MFYLYFSYFAHLNCIVVCVMKYGNILVGVEYYEQGVIIEITKINEPPKEKMNKECVIEGFLFK